MVSGLVLLIMPLQLAIVCRCQNGIVVWVMHPTGVHTHSWICTRDNFSIAAPDNVAQVESVLVALAQHSTQLAGAILQVLQLEV